MAKQPSERYPSAGDLGQAALVAVGELRRAGTESVVATGDAAPFSFGAEMSTPPEWDEEAAGARADDPLAETGSPAAAAADRPRDRATALRWGIALAVLAVLAIGMVAALGALDNL